MAAILMVATKLLIRRRDSTAANLILLALSAAAALILVLSYQGFAFGWALGLVVIIATTVLKVRDLTGASRAVYQAREAGGAALTR